MRQLSERVLDRADILDRATSEYHRPVMLKKGLTDRAHFNYRYENGAVHPMKRVTIPYEVERSWERTMLPPGTSRKLLVT